MFFTDQMRRLTAAAAIALFALLGGCDEPQAPSTTEPVAEETPEPAAPEADVSEPAAAGTDATRPVETDTLPYAEIDQQLVYGFFAAPSDMTEPLPAVIVIHDWWGLNDAVRSSATRLAAAGYIVLAVDLYTGMTVDDVQEARSKMISVLENPQIVRENLRQALGFVEVAGAPSIATLGWGLGGTWSLNAALEFPQQIDAAVVYYGQVSDDERRLAALEAPLLGLFGARDSAVPVSGVRAFEETLLRLGKPHSIEIYEGAGHRFAERGRQGFVPMAANAAWQRVTNFLDEHLAGTPDE